MTRLSLLSEPVQAHGGLAAEGALNLLGRPDLDPLVVLMRESAQNSWDARAAHKATVEFGVHLRKVRSGERDVLRNDIFAELPPKGLGLRGMSGTELRTVLGESDLWVLTISDAGTVGLGGPVRADKPVPDGETSDFIDLVFNIGQPSEAALRGGTYGFGKTIAYLVSQCRTVVIHTVTKSRGRLEHRLIAQAIGHRFSFSSRNFTGRHWWGASKSRGAQIEPVSGRIAERLAASLGFPDLEGAGGGTTLAVLAPNLNGRAPLQAATFMANALAWNFWPKMVPDGRRKATMAFTVHCDGGEVKVPDPARTPPLSTYVEGLKAVRDCEAGRKTPADFEVFPRVHLLRSQRPREDLGWLAMVPVSFNPRPNLDEGVGEDAPVTAANFTGNSHHVALMRGAELVVKYLPGPELPSPAVEWAGVFKAAHAVDLAFAEAEPPTHDDWRSNLVADRWYRTYVNVALREIKERVNSSFGALTVVGDGDGQGSGAVIADALGHLISPFGGTGASHPRSERPEAKGGSSTPKVNVQKRWLAEMDGISALNVEFTVSAAAGSAATVVDISARVATADGRLETDPPAGANMPHLIGLSHGGRSVDGASVRVPSGDDATVLVVIAQPRGVAVALDIRPVPEPMP